MGTMLPPFSVRSLSKTPFKNLLYNRSTMSSTPPLNRILSGFYVVLTLAIGLAALIWPSVRSWTYAPLRDALLPDFYLPTRAGQPVKLVVAAPTTLESWVKTAAAEFTQQNSLIQIEVTPLRGLDANRRLNTVTGQPDVWIAEADFARLAAGGVPYETQGAPLAQDTFIWVAASSQTALAGNLGWRTVAEAANGNPQFRIAMPPLGSLEGMAACLSAAADYYAQDRLSPAQINDAAFRSWLKALLQAAPDLSRNPRDQLASRPPQADAGLILNSDWRQLNQAGFIYQMPAYSIDFNYPYYIRSNWQNVPPDEADTRRAAAEKFKAFLLGSGPQSRLNSFGLERPDTRLTAPLLTVDEVTIRALQFCWQ